MTPPASFQASCDWREKDGLKALWYSSRFYRIGFLMEKEELFIRDWFLYREDYPSRYLEKRLDGAGSVFDALPLLDAHGWKTDEERPKAELVDAHGQAIRKETVSFQAFGEKEMEISWKNAEGEVRIALQEDRMRILGGAGIRFTHLPVRKALEERTVSLEHEGFSYALSVSVGTAETDDRNRIWLKPEDGALEVVFAREAAWEDCFDPEYLSHPGEADDYTPRYQTVCHKAKRYPAAAPRFPEGDRVYEIGQTAFCGIEGEGEIHYTLDGSDPAKDSPCYQEPLRIDKDTLVRARCYREGFLESEIRECRMFFGLPVKSAGSSTEFDSREVFNRNGVWDLLDGRRGSLDYQDGRWLGTQGDLDAVLSVSEEQRIKGVRIGFLSHHRSGIILPEWVELYVMGEEGNWILAERKELPNEPGKREIERQDVCFTLKKAVSGIRIAAHNRKIQPDWACYHGLPGAFLMADSVILEG